jgi:hypothetical protein
MTVFAKFVNKFTESNQGKLLYGLKRLGEMILRIMKPTVKKNKIVLGVTTGSGSFALSFVSLSLHKGG